MAEFDSLLNANTLIFLNEFFITPERIEPYILDATKPYRGRTLKEYFDYLAKIDPSIKLKVPRERFPLPERTREVLEIIKARRQHILAGLAEAATTKTVPEAKQTKAEPGKETVGEKAEKKGSEAKETTPSESVLTGAAVLLGGELPVEGLPPTSRAEVARQALGTTGRGLARLGSGLQLWRFPIWIRERFPTSFAMGGLLGAAGGGILLGPPGMVAGAVLGGLAGNTMGKIITGRGVGGGVQEPQGAEEGGDDGTEAPGEEVPQQNQGTPGGGQPPPVQPPQGGNQGQRPRSRGRIPRSRPIPNLPGAAAKRTLWIWLIVFLVIFGILFFFISGGGIGGPNPSPGTQNQISITKFGTNPTNCTTDCHVDNGQDIVYTFKISYTGVGTANATVTDTLDKQSDFKSAERDGQYNDQTRTVSWSFSNLTPNIPQGFSLTVHPNKDDAWIVNSAQATITSTTGGGGSGVFDSLMRGQGDKNPIGSAEAFLSRAAGVFSALGGKTSQLQQIYDAAISKSLNPIAILTIWKVEQSSFADNFAFNCPDPRKPDANPAFGAQLDCAVSTLRNYMDEFNRNAKDGVYAHPQAPNCVYNDPFLYAYERYTPVCATSDNNAPARGNFVSIYKQLLGQ